MQNNLCAKNVAALTPSLRAKRSNPESLHGKILDCFVASLLAMTNPCEALPAIIDEYCGLLILGATLFTGSFVDKQPACH